MLQSHPEVASLPVGNQVLIDTHVHSDRIWRGYPDENVRYTPTEAVEQVARLRDQAIEDGQRAELTLGGMALTGHDTIDGVNEAMEAGHENGVVVVPGVEVTAFPSRWGLTGMHLVALLPTDIASKLEGVRGFLPTPMTHRIGYVAEWAHDLGGVIIAAHPRPNGNPTALSYEKVLKYAHIEDPAQQIDGVETIFPSELDRLDQLAVLGKLADKATIGSSDAHKLNQIGIAATRLHGLPANFTADDILEAIRKKNTEAVLLNNPGDKARKSSPAAFIRQRLEKTDDPDELACKEALDQWRREKAGKVYA